MNINSTADLDALPNGAVIRDQYGAVCERIGGAWFATGEARPVDVDLPAKLLENSF